MLRLFGKCVAAIALLMGPAAPSIAYQVTIETQAAYAVLDALADKQLTFDRALAIAAMPANQAVIRKVSSFGASVTDEDYARALVSAAAGQGSDDDAFQFVSLRTRLKEVRQTLDEIQANRDAFAQWVSDRVAAYGPADRSAVLSGYLVAGGNSTGFTFRGPSFWLNVGHFRNDALGAKVMVAHELYHAVQAEARRKNKVDDFDPERLAQMRGSERNAYVVNGFLTNLLLEGTAMLVGDPELLEGGGSYSQWDLRRLRTQQARMDRLTTQLDLSLTALTAEEPIDYEDVYALGFYGPDQPLYYLGYAMAKAIEASKGRRRIAELISGDGCAFAIEYIAVHRQRPDATTPQLGAATLRLVARYCAGDR